MTKEQYIEKMCEIARRAHDRRTNNDPLVDIVAEVQIAAFNLGRHVGAEEEREACARLAEGSVPVYGKTGHIANIIMAAAIRKRK